jgi:ribosomal protein S8
MIASVRSSLMKERESKSKSQVASVAYKNIYITEILYFTRASKRSGEHTHTHTHNDIQIQIQIQYKYKYKYTAGLLKTVNY